MKTWISAAVAMMLTLSTSAALACPVGNNGETPPRRPVVQTVAFQASELFERAQSLETAAASHDRQAIAFDRDAETLANRARILRNQAVLVAVADRQGIFQAADDLSARASQSRSQASEERSEASDLRLQARSLRDRATQLVRVNNGGGWKARAGSFAQPPATAGTSGAATSI